MPQPIWSTPPPGGPHLQGLPGHSSRSPQQHRPSQKWHDVVCTRWKGSGVALPASPPAAAAAAGDSLLLLLALVLLASESPLSSKVLPPQSPPPRCACKPRHEEQSAGWHRKRQVQTSRRAKRKGGAQCQRHNPRHSLPEVPQLSTASPLPALPATAAEGAPACAGCTPGSAGAGQWGWAAYLGFTRWEVAPRHPPRPPTTPHLSSPIHEPPTWPLFRRKKTARSSSCSRSVRSPWELQTGRQATVRCWTAWLKARGGDQHAWQRCCSCLWVRSRASADSDGSHPRWDLPQLLFAAAPRLVHDQSGSHCCTAGRARQGGSGAAEGRRRTGWAGCDGTGSRQEWRGLVAPAACTLAACLPRTQACP